MVPLARLSVNNSWYGAYVTVGAVAVEVEVEVDGVEVEVVEVEEPVEELPEAGPDCAAEGAPERKATTQSFPEAMFATGVPVIPDGLMFPQGRDVPATG